MITVLPFQLNYSILPQEKLNALVISEALNWKSVFWNSIYSTTTDEIQILKIQILNFHKSWDLLTLFLELRTGKQVFNSTMKKPFTTVY